MIGSVADSCSTSTRSHAASRTRSHQARVVDTTPVIVGMYARRDCRAADRATARHRRRPLSTFGEPSQRATHRDGLPGDERVGARLGGQLDGQFGAVGLWAAPARRSPAGRAIGTVRRSSTRAVSRPLPTSSTTQCATVAVAVAQVEFLAGPDPPHVGRVEALVAVDDRQLTDLGQRVDVEQRAGHRKISGR